MKEQMFNLVAFNSTHNAIKAEKELISNKINVRIIPVPTEITANCGLAIKINLEDFNTSKEILHNNGIEVSGYYIVQKIGLKNEIKRVE